MSPRTDCRPIAVRIYFLPVETRLPLKFGPETVTQVTCARVALTVEGSDGSRAVGWGETPLSVQWVWPGTLSYDERHEALVDCCRRVAKAWLALDRRGHPLTLGHGFLQEELPRLLEQVNHERAEQGRELMPYLAALVASSAFDLALHDAFGQLHGVPTYSTYSARYLDDDLAEFLIPAPDANLSFAGRYPQDFFVSPAMTLPAWHLVGGLDLVSDADRAGAEPEDGYPVVLGDWIDRDGLECLKIKLRGTDCRWDFDRLVRVGRLAVDKGCRWLSADFNCTVTDPAYVNEILDRLLVDEPRVFGAILYVEQPFPYDLERNRIDVRSVAARKPLFMDESAHDWKLVRMGRSLGWSGVALKTCKTQTGALLSLAWAKAHGMLLMVQDLTNPMLAQIPHLLLAAHAGTIYGVETNAMQFYPEASRPEAVVHPGLYVRRRGRIDLSSVRGPGFGYRIDEIARKLPDPALSCEN